MSSFSDNIWQALNGVADPDTSDRPVVALAVNYAKGQTIPPHTHERGQLMFVISGSLRVETGDGIWVATPGRACWIPGGLSHSVSYAKASQLRTAYIRPDFLPALPEKCCVLRLTALLRELVIAAAQIGWSYEDNSPQGRLMQVLIDQITGQAESPLFLPEGKDARLKRLTALLYENPGDNRSLEDWCHLAGASSRTLSRLFLKETGMTFSAWRQQLCLIRAVEMLTEGYSVTQIAFALGYGSTGSFTTMFTRAMGEPPTAYLSRWEHSF